MPQHAPSSSHRSAPRLLVAGALLALLAGLGGCTVITVASTATSLAVGAVKLTGAVVGTAVDLVVPDGDDENK